MSDIPRSIEALGTLLDTRASAHDAAQQFRQRADALRQRYASRPPVSVFYQVWEQPLMTLNGQHIFSDMLTLCGGRNVFAGEPLLVPTVSPEAVIAANPEVLLTASMGATTATKSPRVTTAAPAFFPQSNFEIFRCAGSARRWPRCGARNPQSFCRIWACRLTRREFRRALHRSAKSWKSRRKPR